MHRREHVDARFAEQPSETDVKPVDEVGVVDGHELCQRVDKHTEHFAVRVVKHPSEDLRHTLHLTTPTQRSE